MVCTTRQRTSLWFHVGILLQIIWAISFCGCLLNMEPYVTLTAKICRKVGWAEWAFYLNDKVNSKTLSKELLESFESTPEWGSISPNWWADFGQGCKSLLVLSSEVRTKHSNIFCLLCDFCKIFPLGFKPHVHGVWCIFSKKSKNFSLPFSSFWGLESQSLQVHPVACVVLTES